VSVQVNKASIHIENRQFADGLVAADVGLAIATRALPPESVSFANLYNNRAQALLELGRLDEALVMAKRAEDQGAKVYGATNASACMYGLNTAATLARMGQTREAITEFKRLLAVFEASLLPNHEWTAEALSELGAVEVEAGQAREAIPHLERGLVALEKHQGATMLMRRRHAATAFALARALASTGTRGRRVAELAWRARADFVDLGEASRLAQLDAWVVTANVKPEPPAAAPATDGGAP
jgi:tetratricopeptide (TPR) repeat protein